VIQQKENFSLRNWEIVSINPAEKNWTWRDLFCFWGNGVQNIIGFSLITSLYLIYDLNAIVVFIGTLAASLLVYFFSNLIGKPSQKHGLPFPVILRTSMGVNGARYVALLRGLVGIFMFGVQTFFISKSIGYLLRILLFKIDSNILNNEIFFTFFMGLDLIDGVSLLLTLLIQFLIFSNGINTNRLFINFSALFVYFGLILFLIVIFSEHYNELLSSFKLTLSIDNAISRNNLFPLLTVTGTMFAYFSILIVNFGDFSRYVKNEKELNKGNLSLILNLLLFSFLSVFIVLGADIILVKNLIQVDKFLTNPTDIIANYIPSQNTLLNFLPKSLSLKSSGILIIFISFFVSLFWLPVLSQIGILSMIDTIGSFFGPISGVIIADFYLIRNKKIINKDIFSSLSTSTYYYSNGWQIKGVYSILIGFIFSSATIWNVNLNFLQSFSWIIGAFISWLTYYLLASK
jgi:NCS1 family nucleobase:cation symporter-1